MQFIGGALLSGIDPYQTHFITLYCTTEILVRKEEKGFFSKLPAGFNKKVIQSLLTIT